MVERPVPRMPLDGQKPCIHHWLIENPAGETSRGVCKYCGASRYFRNTTAKGHNQYASRGRVASGPRAG